MLGPELLARLEEASRHLTEDELSEEEARILDALAYPETLSLARILLLERALDLFAAVRAERAAQSPTWSL